MSWIKRCWAGIVLSVIAVLMAAHGYQYQNTNMLFGAAIIYTSGHGLILYRTIQVVISDLQIVYNEFRKHIECE